MRPQRRRQPQGSPQKPPPPRQARMWLLHARPCRGSRWGRTSDWVLPPASTCSQAAALQTEGPQPAGQLPGSRPAPRPQLRGRGTSAACYALCARQRRRRRRHGDSSRPTSRGSSTACTSRPGLPLPCSPGDGRPLPPPARRPGSRSRCRCKAARHQASEARRSCKMAAPSHSRVRSATCRWVLGLHPCKAAAASALQPRARAGLS